MSNNMKVRNAKAGALVALGANLPSSVGPPAQTIRASLEKLTELGHRVDLVSKYYITPCFPAGAGPDFVNVAARISTSADPAALLSAFHRVEESFGRERVKRWSARTLDLDLLAVDDVVRPDLETFVYWRDLSAQDQQVMGPDQLILPHPRIQDRAFVLIPLADVAPDWCHPVSRKTVLEMVKDLPSSDRSAVKVMKTPQI